MAESLYPVIPGLVVGQKVNGRAIYDRKAKRALVKAALVPGVSVARLAMDHAVNANLLRKWIRLYEIERGAIEPSPKALLPVVTVDESRDAPRTVVDAPASHIEIEIGAAVVRVRGAVDAQQLRVVLSCLRDRS